ncbi:hypothetical protein C0991_005819, partial [Blastosporella zonata]
MTVSLMDDTSQIKRGSGGLWSSSREIYETVEEVHIPTTDLSVADIQRGINAIVIDQSQSISRVNAHPAALGPPKSRKGAWAMKAERIIEAVEADSQATSKTLDFGINFPSIEQLRALLDDATVKVQTGGNSLSLVKNLTPSVLEHKKKVLEMLRTIDNRISQLGALLPPQTTHQGPVLVEA